MGDSATVVLMSLHELYEALEETLIPLIHQARIAFGTLFGLHVDQSAIEDQTMFELETNLSPEVGISLPMDYAFYYQPLFRRFGPLDLDPEVYSRTKMNGWIHGMRPTPDDPHKLSPEARALIDLANNGNELLWTMTTLVAGLNACLTPDNAVLVLSTAFSVCSDPRCVLPARGSWSCHICCDTNSPSACTKHLQSDIPSQVRRFFEKGSQPTELQRPRYALDCTIGKRLAEDFILISHLADKCGLQEETSRSFASSSVTRSHVTQDLGLSANRDKADLTLALVALISQTLPWTVKLLSGGEPHSMHHALFVYCRSRSVLHVHTSAMIVRKFVNAIQSTGIPVSVEEGDWSQCYPHMRRVPKRDRQASYGGTAYARL